MATVSRLSNSVLRQAFAAKQSGVRLGDHYPKELVDDVFACALKKQTGVSLKYMYVNYLYSSMRELGMGKGIQKPSTLGRVKDPSVTLWVVVAYRMRFDTVYKYMYSPFGIISWV